MYKEQLFYEMLYLTLYKHRSITVYIYIYIYLLQKMNGYFNSIWLPQFHALLPHN